MLGSIPSISYSETAKTSTLDFRHRIRPSLNFPKRSVHIFSNREEMPLSWKTSNSPSSTSLNAFVLASEMSSIGSTSSFQVLRSAILTFYRVFFCGPSSSVESYKHHFMDATSAA